MIFFSYNKVISFHEWRFDFDFYFFFLLRDMVIISLVLYSSFTVNISAKKSVGAALEFQGGTDL